MNVLLSLVACASGPALTEGSYLLEAKSERGECVDEVLRLVQPIFLEVSADGGDQRWVVTDILDVHPDLDAACHPTKLECEGQAVYEETFDNGVGDVYPNARFTYTTTIAEAVALSEQSAEISFLTEVTCTGDECGEATEFIPAPCHATQLMTAEFVPAGP